MTLVLLTACLLVCLLSPGFVHHQTRCSWLVCAVTWQDKLVTTTALVQDKLVTTTALVQDKMSEAVAQGLISAEQVAGSILGERSWVRWPFLQEALVQAVSDRSHKVTPCPLPLALKKEK